MKHRFLGVLLSICALMMICGCSTRTSTTATMYTPAPVTPRPTFDTVRYRTKEQIDGTVKEELVIKNGAEVGGGYVSPESEYTLVNETTPAPARNTYSGSVNTSSNSSMINSSSSSSSSSSSDVITSFPSFSDFEKPSASEMEGPVFDYDDYDDYDEDEFVPDIEPTATPVPTKAPEYGNKYTGQIAG